MLPIEPKAARDSSRLMTQTRRCRLSCGKAITLYSAARSAIPRLVWLFQAEPPIVATTG